MLDRAAQALRDWRLHAKALTDYGEGKISLAEARRRWDETTKVGWAVPTASTSKPRPTRTPPPAAQRRHPTRRPPGGPQDPPNLPRARADRPGGIGVPGGGAGRLRDDATGLCGAAVDASVRPIPCRGDEGRVGGAIGARAGHGRADGTPRPFPGHRRRTDSTDGHDRERHRRGGGRQDRARAIFRTAAALQSIATPAAGSSLDVIPARRNRHRGDGRCSGGRPSAARCHSDHVRYCLSVVGETSATAAGWRSAAGTVRLFKISRCTCLGENR